MLAIALSFVLDAVTVRAAAFYCKYRMNTATSHYFSRAQTGLDDDVARGSFG
jgi:hypothetical protein